VRLFADLFLLLAQGVLIHLRHVFPCLLDAASITRSSYDVAKTSGRSYTHFVSLKSRPHWSLGVANPTREGVLYGLAAYGWWGLVPLYFSWLGRYPSLNFLAHRIVWSAVLLAVVLTLTRRWKAVLACFASRLLLLPLTVSAVLVACNWLIYILSVEYRMISQASLGYYILPLMSILLGLIFFRERLRPLQNLAIALAGIGVLSLTWQGGRFPWLALGIASTFSFYGLIRKQVPVDGLVGLAVETIVLTPIAAGFLLWHYLVEGELESAAHLGKLALSGVVTAVPLLCFGQAARRLPLSTLGFMQYLAPSLQLILAVWHFEEPAPGWLSYAFIWTALVIFSIDSLRQPRQESGVRDQESGVSGQESAGDGPDVPRREMLTPDS
jgi:chloramphenicol-sensitive protein RarD